MRADRLIVLKFGGSVLRDERSLRLAVHEIHRWRREGWRIVAVVSALEGRTDALATQADSISTRPSAFAKAQLLAQGELESAALLSLHLDRAGIPAASISPAAARFIAEGDPLSAAPRSIDSDLLHAALGQDGVLVFPGFIAIDTCGRTVTLGRGGSDLTALFLAHELGADRCRLIKDVDGLYDADPAKSLRARRYAQASYRNALATDGSILQREAVRFAKSRGLTFEVAGVNSPTATRIGDFAATFAERAAPQRPLRVALLGLGVVGCGVYDLLRGRDDVEIVAIAVRNLDRKRDVAPPRRLLTTDAVGAAGAGVDLVIEALGGIETPFLAARAALESGAHVVTANKALMAAHGRDLNRIAIAQGLQLRCSGAVGGVAPILETIRAHRGREIHSVSGVLNGTCNFILDALARGESLDRAVREAQRLGFAEADPTRDLCSDDALDKLHVVAQALGARRVRTDLCDDLREFVQRNPSAPARAPHRQIAMLKLDDRGEAVASVRIAPVERDGTQAEARAEWNAAVIHWADGGATIIRGKGAGRWPTAESVLGDVLQIMREARAALPAQAPTGAAASPNRETSLIPV